MNSKRLQEVIIYASDLHATQKRKGKDVPYIFHLMGVTAIVLELGGTENEAIAALLHDAVEDQDVTVEEIRQRFNDEVAEIVEGCTDSDTSPKPNWWRRQEKYIAHLREAGPSVKLVAAADKLYNARTILADYRTQEESVWQRFVGGKDEILWYYRTLVKTFEEIGSPLTGEFGRIIYE